MRMAKLIGLLALVLAVSACRLAPPSVYDNYVKIAIPSEPQTFNPLWVTDVVSQKMTSVLFSGLIDIEGEDFHASPALAESWTVSQDGLTWTFVLREGVLWSDGQPLTADDVVFTYQTLINDASLPISARDGFVVQGRPIQWTKLSDRSVQAVLPAPYSSFVWQLTFPVLPKHKLLDRYQSKQLLSMWSVDDDLTDIVGTGPLRLKAYLPGERLVFEKNPHYWKQDDQGARLPYVDGLIAFVMSDPNAALLKFRRGELDVLGLDGESYAFLAQDSAQERFRILELGPSWGTQFLALHLQAEALGEEHRYLYDWFKQTSFRQALSCAIDRQRMIDTMLYGQGYPQYGPLTQANQLYYDDSISKFRYNPQRARELLREGGFVWQDEQLYDHQGRQVTFELMVVSDQSSSLTMAHMIQSDLRAIGIELRLYPLPFGVVVQKLMQNQPWQAMLLGLSGSPDPNNGRNVWLSQGHLHFWNMRPQHLFAWEEAIDRLFDEAQQTMSEPKQKQLYSEWQKLVATELPLIYTVTPAAMVALHARIVPFAMTSYEGFLENLDQVRIQ